MVARPALDGREPAMSPLWGPLPATAEASREWASPHEDHVFRTSPAMRLLHDMIERVAEADVTVLIWGESGVGKELVAHRVHTLSPRRERPFIKVNCAALPGELLESELFGHERGAFTGAHRVKPGKFEVANTGTMFLDEVGELPLPLQAKLLQVLQDGQFSRLGSPQDVKVDVRVIAATNRNLSELVERAGFRKDLYYRLNVVNIRVPALRERAIEIPILVNHFLRQYSRQYNRPQREISAETLRRFMSYSWPGNVRELENLVKRLVLLSNEEWVCEQLGAQSETPVPALPHQPGARWASLANEIVAGRAAAGLKDIARQAARSAERALMKEVLERVHWNRRMAARCLKISYKALLQKIRLFGLQ
jgi:two-component system response regulator AtoC